MSTRKTNPLIKALNSSITASKERGHQLITNAKRLEEQRMLIRAKYSAAFKDLSEEDASSLFVTDAGDHPTIHVSLRGLTGFKDPKLTNFLEFFMQFTDQIEEREWAEYMNKDYTIECPDARIVVGAYVRDDSPTCRRVPTGTRLEEVKIGRAHV